MAWVSGWRVSVLDCGSPLPLFSHKTGERKAAGAAALQNRRIFTSVFRSGHG